MRVKIGLINLNVIHTKLAGRKIFSNTCYKRILVLRNRLKGSFQKLLTGFFPLRGGGYPQFLLRVFGHDDFPLRGERGTPNSAKEKNH